MRRFEYEPRERQQMILDRAWEHVQAVPYSVSLRWLFYRLYQEGAYTRKEDYSRFKSLMSQARKRFYGPWTPDSLVDDTRQIETWGEGFRDKAAFLYYLARNSYCELDKLRTQDEIVVILFEAKAMSAQFAYYLPHASARLPFGGDVSIPAKWAIAELLVERWGDYEVPVHVVYFGDYDPKGLSIEKAAKYDILDWADRMLQGEEVDFDWIRGGLNEDQVEGYGLPLSIDGNGYQWEALTDEQAQEIIMDAVGDLIDEDAILETEGKEEAITVEFRSQFKEAFKL